ncbi:MAG: Mur ligase family protein, partial [Candidatus Curtissbacteria bacterium]
MFKDYYEARAWLEEFIPLVYGKEELGLTRIEYLLKLLGNPENKFKSIHIAGTSGKGSTAFYTVRLLQEAGSVILGSPSDSLGINSTTPESFLFVDSGRSQNDKKKFKVGLHVSPHLTYIGERMRINGKPIEVSELIRLMEKIRPAVESMKSAKVGPPKTLGETRPYTGGLPSYFEILVAASFVYFAREKVDYAVVEVGLGGRLDATNVLVPEISIITNIGLDHTEILGKTISAIAGEKSGIIKVGVPVVTGASGKALRVIEMTARKTGSKLIKVTTQKGFLGNQILAKTALETLGIRIGDSLTKKVFERGFEGRFEKIEEDVILDGAHNPDKIRALIRW